MRHKRDSGNNGFSEKLVETVNPMLDQGIDVTVTPTTVAPNAPTAVVSNADSAPPIHSTPDTVGEIEKEMDTLYQELDVTVTPTTVTPNDVCASTPVVSNATSDPPIHLIPDLVGKTRPVISPLTESEEGMDSSYQEMGVTVTPTTVAPNVVFAPISSSVGGELNHLTSPLPSNAAVFASTSSATLPDMTTGGLNHLQSPLPSNASTVHSLPDDEQEIIPPLREILSKAMDATGINSFESLLDHIEETNENNNVSSSRVETQLSIFDTDDDDEIMFKRRRTTPAPVSGHSKKIKDRSIEKGAEPK